MITTEYIHETKQAVFHNSGGLFGRRAVRIGSLSKVAENIWEFFHQGTQQRFTGFTSVEAFKNWAELKNIR